MATVVTDHRDSSNAWNFGPAMEGAQPRDRIADHMGTVLAHGCSRVGGRAHTPAGREYGTGDSRFRYVSCPSVQHHVPEYSSALEKMGVEGHMSIAIARL